jgi:hypothetical protein
MIKQIAAFCRNRVIIEFVPPEDAHVSNWMNYRFSWYNMEGFMKAIKNFFVRCEVVESSSYPRKLIFCEEKKQTTDRSDKNNM